VVALVSPESVSVVPDLTVASGVVVLPLRYTKYPATPVPPVVGKSVEAVQVSAMLFVVTAVVLRPVGTVGA
jgi:hypothetical protein